MKYNDQYWTDRMIDRAPEHVQRAIKRIYNTYPPECLPQGLCDPMYIMNVICYEMGTGDGQGNFIDYKKTPFKRGDK